MVHNCCSKTSGLAFSFLFCLGRLQTAAKKLKAFVDSRTQPALLHPCLEGYLCNPEGTEHIYVYTVHKAYTVYKQSVQALSLLQGELPMY